MDPAVAAVGSVVTLHGSNLLGAELVAFGGTEQRAFTVVSAERIDATLPPDAKSGQVRVTTGAGTATWDGFVVLPQPTLTLVTPEAGAGIGRPVTLHGTHLAEASAIQFTGAAQPTFTVVSDGELSTTVPLGATTGPIRVTTPGGSATSAPFTVRPEPLVTGFDPSTGAGIGLPVGLLGLHLTGATRVRFSGVEQPDFTVTSDGRIDTTVPTGATSGPVEVETPEGTATSPPFTVLPPPVIEAFDPAAGAGVGVSVALLGAHLSGASVLSFHGVDQPAFVIVSDDRIETTVPAGAATGPVTVTTPGGTGASAPFTVIPAPVITGFSPAAGADIGQLVILDGDHFTGASALIFNGTGQPAFTVLSPNQLRARVPQGATTGPLAVTTPGGTATSSVFVVPTPPDVVAVTAPASGGSVGGCVQVSYTVAQQDGVRADIVVELDASGLGTFLPANTRRATQAGSAAGVQPFGVSGVPTSAAGTPHTFLWNSSADFPLATTTGVALRVRAARKGSFGAFPPPLTGLTVANATGAACAVRLSGPAVQPTGATPRSVAVGDFNGDGKPDLINSNYFGNSVSVSLGRGDGTYQAPIFLALGAQPGQVDVGDFNQDGFLDAVVIVGGSARLLVGDGTGALQQMPVLGGSSASNLLVIDLNGDGHLDVLAGAFNSLAFLGNGDGTFQSVPLTGLQNVVAMRAADVDDDGFVDLVTLHGNANDASVSRGKGDGTFHPALKFGTGQAPAALALGDVDGDGFLDLLVTGNGTQTVSLLRGQANATFGAPTPLPGVSYPGSLRLGDFDGDGQLDYAVSRAATPGGGVLVGFGNGDGTFQPGPFISMPALSTEAAVADLDGDGVHDLAAAAYGGNAAWVMCGSADRSFGLARHDVGTTPAAIARGDLNGDGSADLVVTSNYTVSVLLAAPGGGFQPASSFPGDKTATAVALGDVNNDGHLDLLFTGSDLTVRLGTGNGTFGAEVTFPAGGDTRGLALADMNKDGKVDVVVTTSNGGEVLLGSGTGTFAAPVSFSSGGALTQAVAVADLNGDGNPDVVLANLFIAHLSVLLGNGSGGFSSSATYAAGAGMNAVGVADVNGDGKPDIVAASAGGHSVAVLLGTTPGAFGPATIYPTGQGPSAVGIADVSGDGVVDVVTADNQSGSVSVLRGNGDGAFQEAVGWGAGAKPVGLVVADLDGDGRPDVATALADNSGHLVVLRAR